MNRFELQQLSDARIEDARVLLESNRWAGGYYLLGYAVECALKACAAARFRQDEVPEKAVVNDFYTHRLDRLLEISGVKAALEAHVRASASFRAHWDTARDWNETTRYDVLTSEDKARNMFVAVCDSSAGVQTWLKARW